MKSYDVVVIGGGPGGYVSAIRSAQLGLKTCVVEAEHLGGICLNWGCIPTKALLRSAEVYELAKSAQDYGVKIDGEITYDFEAMVKRSRQVAARLSKGVSFLLKKNGVDVIEARAKIGRLIGEDREIICGEKADKNICGRHIIIATGARARELPGFAVDGKQVWNYKDAMTAKEAPKRLLVIGSGAIGMEFASFYSSLGSKVTVVEALPKILPAEDGEISAFVQKIFVKRGIEIKTGVKLDGLKKSADGVEIMLAGEKRQFDKVCMAVGIVGNIESIGLEDLKGVKTEKSHIVTDGFGRTGEKGIYAIGDVTGAPWLAHKAEHEGVICVEKIAKITDVHPMEKSKIPGCTYTHPQVASVGITEQEAKEKAIDYRVGRFSAAGNGKAVALGDTEGMIKTIVDNKTGEILGAHMVGPEVTELIQGYVIAMKGELLEEDLAHTVFPHPTLSEMMHETILDGMGRVIHL